MATTASASTRRYDALAALVNPITEDTDLDAFVQIADAMEIDLAPLGRTDRWKSACSFARVEIRTAESKGELTLRLARWAVLQGSVYMGYAAE